MADIEITTADPSTLAGIRGALGTPEAARTLRIPDSEVSPPSPVIPNLAGRQNKTLGFDVTGAPVGTTAGGLPTISAAIMALSPYVYWKLDETSGTVIADSSGNSRPGTLSGTVTLAQAGPEGTNTAMTFTAGRVTANSTWNHTDWTAAAWIKPTFSAPAHAPALWCQRDSATVRYSTHIASDREGIESWNGALAGNADWAGTIVDLMKDNAWYHVVLVLKSTGRLCCYVNGRLVSSAARTLGAVTTQPLAFGSSGVAFGEPWIGGAAHLAYWNRVLSEREIWKLYAAG